MNSDNTYIELLMRHRKMLWRMCWRQACGDRELCSDLLQEVSIALWKNHDKLRPKVKPAQERAWVCWQARSVFYQHSRQQKPSTVPLSDEYADSISDEDAQHRKELMEELLSALDPDEQRMVGLYLEGYQGKEIAQKMGISRDNYYQRMHRAIQKMRRTVLILLLLLFVSVVAIAFTPQWRHFFFGGGEVEEAVADTLHEPPVATPTVTPPDTVVIKTQTRDTARKTEKLEHLPQLNPMDLLDIPSEMPSLAMQDSLTIRIDGNSLVITGAEGEYVRVYDVTGRLVAAQMAGRYCILDLHPANNLYCGFYYKFYLQIGTRPTLELNL